MVFVGMDHGTTGISFAIMNDTEELSREVYNFKELWTYVYDNVNNDLFATFQVDCKTK